MSSASSTRQRLKEILVESLNLEGTTPEMNEDDMLLWGDGLGLDSVDALELMVALEREYGFRIDSDELAPDAFATVARLEEFVETQRAAQAGG
jgi:acyl carrier protein